MARARSAWWPGGRIAEKAFLTLPVITSSTACTAAPTPRSTASKVPGDMVVSASIAIMPSRGATSSIAFTYAAGWASSAIAAVPSGAGSRTSPAKRSSSSARSIARMRSGRSGWPGGVWWSSAAGWLRRSVDMLAFGSRDRFAALSQPTPELSMTRAIAAVTAMQHGHALRPRPCPRGFRIGSAGRNPRAA